MGQYYKIVNVDKKQIMVPWDYDCGAKLMEWSYSGCRFVLTLLNLLKKEWKGDRVYVVGDYADYDELNGDEEIWQEAYNKAHDEIAQGYTPRPEDKDYPPTIYSMTEEWDIVPEQFEHNSSDVRFIYNHALQEYIDLDHCPIEWVWVDSETGSSHVSKVAPLPLLLAMGNGRGGGDYHEDCNNAWLVGAWCDTASEIDCEAAALPACSHYTEFEPDFTERDPVVPCTDVLQEIMRVMERGC